MKIVNLMYFSPTLTTKKVVEEIGLGLVKKEDIKKGVTIDFTLPPQREKQQCFNTKDILIIGVPVYAGRVPNILLKYLNTIKGEHTLAVPIVLYGNRHYDDALVELQDILRSNGFIVIAGGAFIGEHSFSYKLAQGRPDEKDLDIARVFVDEIYKKAMIKPEHTVQIKGHRPYKAYYKPKNDKNQSVDIRKVQPKTNDNCTYCKNCAEVCPMGSIPSNAVNTLVGICIKCGACIKSCPTQAKYFDDPNYLRHKQELENQYRERKAPELFL